MSDTGTQKGPDLTGVQRFAGVGHASSWDCGACGNRLFSTLGRRLRYLQGRGIKAYVCPPCVKEMAK